MVSSFIDRLRFFAFFLIPRFTTRSERSGAVCRLSPYFSSLATTDRDRLVTERPSTMPSFSSPGVDDLGHSGRPHMSTADLLPQEPLALSLRQRCPLDRSRLLDERRIQSGGNSRDDSMVIAGELGCGHRNRRSPPYVIAIVTQESGQLGLPGGCVERRSAMACAEGRESGESRRHCGPATGLLCNQNLIKEADFRVACGVSFSLMNEFVEDFVRLVRCISDTRYCSNSYLACPSSSWRTPADRTASS